MGSACKRPGLLVPTPFSIVAPRGWIGLPGAQVGGQDLALSLASLMTHNWLVLQCPAGKAWGTRPFLLASITLFGVGFRRLACASGLSQGCNPVLPMFWAGSLTVLPT